jgi:putative transposase
LAKLRFGGGRTEPFPHRMLAIAGAKRDKAGSISMRSRYRFNEPDHAHFITSTVVEWLPVFTTPDCCDILVQSLEYCRAHKGLQLHAWVIMENHFHAVVAAPDLSRVIADLKKFTAKALLEQLDQERRDWLLAKLRQAKGANRTRSEYQLWQEGVHPQAIIDDAMMLQKIDYIHNNPVRRGWVASPEHWRYSSAHEWLPGVIPLMRCDPWR